MQRLSHEVGWGYKDVVDRLEEKRKIKAQAFHERKVCLFLVSFGLTSKVHFVSLLLSSCVKRQLQTPHHRSLSWPNWGTRVVIANRRVLLVDTAICTLCTARASV